MNLKPSDIISTPFETHTGTDFSKLIIAAVETSTGKVYDLLFDEKGELIKPGEQTEVVNKVAAFFEKDFKSAMFDGSPCCLHINRK